MGLYSGGPLSWEGLLSEGYLRLRFWGPFLGGAFYRNFTVALFPPNSLFCLLSPAILKKKNKQTNKKQTSQSLCLLCTNTS